MTKKRLLLFAALLFSAIWVTQAQTQETFVTVKHYQQGILKTDIISMKGGIAQILNNTVMIFFANNPAQNRSYEFDNINTMNFELRNVSVPENIISENLKVYFDGVTLHITSTQAIGKVIVFSFTGAQVAEVESDTNTAQINLSALPKGAYIVQAGTNKVKFIK
jgi:hypothetical protein